MSEQQIHEQLAEHVTAAFERVVPLRRVLSPKDNGDLAVEALSNFMEEGNIALVQLPDPQPARDGVSTMFGDFTVSPDGRVTFRDDSLHQDLEALQWQAQTRLAAIETARRSRGHGD